MTTYTRTNLVARLARLAARRSTDGATALCTTEGFQQASEFYGTDEFDEIDFSDTARTRLANDVDKEIAR